MKTISTYRDLCAAIFDALGDKTPDQVRQECDASGSRLNLLSRALNRYHAAEDASKKFGFIGVGCISFAEARLEKFSRKVCLS